MPDKTTIEKLASSLGRKDEIPNQELAKEIVEQNDSKAVKELVKNLNNKNKDIQSDCIKVLYEIGEAKPTLIAKHTKTFIDLLESKNNRLQWGAMTAIDTIVPENPELVYNALPKILETAEKGSVITKDHAVNILIKLCSVEQFSENSFSLLIEQLLKSPVNQLPMYAERALPIIRSKNKELFIKTLTARLDDIDKDTKRKRVEKVIKKISGQ